MSARYFPDVKSVVTLSCVQTQSFSQKAPPAVWNLAISYHTPEYLSLEKLGEGVGNLHYPAKATLREPKIARVAIATVEILLMSL